MNRKMIATVVILGGLTLLGMMGILGGRQYVPHHDVFIQTAVSEQKLRTYVAVAEEDGYVTRAVQDRGSISFTLNGNGYDQHLLDSPQVFVFGHDEDMATLNQQALSSSENGGCYTSVFLAYRLGELKWQQDSLLQN